MELLKYKNELNNLIEKSSNIFIMGHRFLDLDAIGGSIGIYEYVKSKGKRPIIKIDKSQCQNNNVSTKGVGIIKPHCIS